MATVIMVGSATVDEQLLDASASRVQLGGVVTYGGAAFVKGGVSALAVCNLGGGFADAATGVFKSLGISLCAGTTDVMTSFRNKLLADGEREQYLLRLGRPIDEELVVRALNNVKRPHIHLGPVHGQDISRAALRAVAAQGETVTLDVQGFLRPASHGEVRQEVTRLLPDALAASRIVKADRAELDVLLKTSGQTVSDLLQEYDIDEIVVTCGKEGGYVVDRSRRRVNFGAVPAARLHDTTGAGDVFFAAYLIARLYEGQTTLVASERAAGIAAEHVAGDFVQVRVLSLTDRL